MLEFKVIKNLKPNKDLTNILKDFKYNVKLGKIKTILHTSLQIIIPTSCINTKINQFYYICIIKLFKTF